MTKRWTLLTTAALVVLATSSCRDEPPPTQTLVAVQGAQELLDGATTPITDEYDGRPVHGAIFTTTPFGDVVNANTKYTRKIEVYLDGGPRNANAQSAGLNDGLYVFQITDPPGKNLLSQDPARCRVVQVDGGVIIGTVPAYRIPGITSTQNGAGATVTDKWSDSPGENRQCHVESSEADGASLAGQHDSNVDSDPGGGTTAQMMPFLDTPNPGGVYKAWITPLAVYRAKGGNLNTIPAPGTGRRSTTTATNVPDAGFGPARNNVKTDNFKVVENPPFIRITKLLDGVSYTGWPVTVYEFIESAWVGAGWRPTPATFAVPFGTSVLACEKLQAGSVFVGATVNGASVAVSNALTTDEDGNPIVCVSVPGITSPSTVDVVFSNATPALTLSISPLDDTNGIGEAHQITATVQQDDKLPAGAPGDAVTGFGPAVGATVVFSLTNSNGATATFVGGDNDCVTGAAGTCSVSINSPTSGTVVIHATTTFTVAGVSLTAQTGPGLATAVGDDARKVYVDGALIWRKVDGVGTPIAGATFRVRRTHDRFGAAVSTPNFLVTDDQAPDVDADDGEFRVEDLPLGSYCVKETVAPAGYLIDPTERCGAVIAGTTQVLDLQLSLTNLVGNAGDFVNSINGRMTGGTGKVEITEDVYLTAGFTIHCDILLSNNLEINWPGNKWHLSKPIATALCTDQPLVDPENPDAPLDTFEGTAEGSLNGVAGSWVQFIFQDGGEPGKKADKVKLVIWQGAIGGGTPVLSIGVSELLAIRGNIQAHEDQPHRGR